MTLEFVCYSNHVQNTQPAQKQKARPLLHWFLLCSPLVSKVSSINTDQNTDHTLSANTHVHSYAAPYSNCIPKAYDVLYSNLTKLMQKLKILQRHTNYCRDRILCCMKKVVKVFISSPKTYVRMKGFIVLTKALDYINNRKQ